MTRSTQDGLESRFVSGADFYWNGGFETADRVNGAPSSDVRKIMWNRATNT